MGSNWCLSTGAGLCYWTKVFFIPTVGVLRTRHVTLNR
jgi:hypothetical protein